MALVAYSDDSDLGTDSEDGEEVAGKACGGEASGKTAAGASQATQGSGVDSIEDEDEDNSVREQPSTLFSSVPAALPVTSVSWAGQEEDEVVDVPTVDTWKVTQELKKQNNNVVGALQPGTQHKKERKKVKILLPSLSEFADDDDEEEEERKEPPRKKLNPSSSGSGLFSVLPAPKHQSAKEAGRSLVPHVLTKRLPQPKKSQRKNVKVTTATEGTAATGAAGDVSDDDDDNEAPTGTSDFFSLSEPSAFDVRAAGGLVTNPAPAAAAPSVETIREVAKLPNNQPEEPPPVMEQQYQDYEVEDPGNMMLNPPQPAAAAAGGIDEAALLRLTGKRSRGEAISFIDVNADDALLTRQEWMTKALSEEKPQHGFSKKREGLPTQKQKQKHQITYLAHQAKERELDLKNSWAQNRMTKMQSQAKYGF